MLCRTKDTRFVASCEVASRIKTLVAVLLLGPRIGNTFACTSWLGPEHDRQRLCVSTVFQRGLDVDQQGHDDITLPCRTRTVTAVGDSENNVAMQSHSLHGHDRSIDQLEMQT